jgi:hypothetical protein
MKVIKIIAKQVHCLLQSLVQSEEFCCCREKTTFNIVYLKSFPVQTLSHLSNFVLIRSQILFKLIDDSFKQRSAVLHVVI